MKILCVEDDEGLAALLQPVLVKQHYQVDFAADGLIGWNLAETETYDLILLDWIVPKLTGIEFCQQLRIERHSVAHLNQNTPVLLMTALDEVTCKVMGLNAGADDYIVKPFDLDELLARMRALLRRGQTVRTPLLQWGEVCLNPNSCEVTYQGQPIAFAAKEYELLELFLRNPNQIFSLDRLLNALWNLDEMPGEGAVRAHIKGLRQKLKRVGVDDPIETIYKLGYRLKPQKINDEADQASEAVAANPSSSDACVCPELWEAWQAVRQSYRDRLSTIQQAVTALQNQTLTLEQQQIAEREAHTLVGSLGSFGLEEASRISRQIQQTFKQSGKQSGPLTQADIEKLRQWIAALWQQLGTSVAEKPKPIDPRALQAAAPSSMPLLLIVDNDIAWMQELTKAALSWGLQAEIAISLRDAQQWLQNGVVNVMLLNLDFADSSKNGLEFLARVYLQHATLPVVTLTAEASFEQRIEAARLGIRCFLKKPIAPVQVLAAVAPVLSFFNPSSARILIMDPDPEALHFNTLLTAQGYQVTLLSKPQHFWQTLEQTEPDLLILAVEFCSPTSSESEQRQSILPALNGIELCQVIRNDPDWNCLPVVFWSGQKDSKMAQRCLTVGGDDFLSKPVAAQELLTRVQTWLEQRKRWGIRGRSPIQNAGNGFKQEK